MTKNKFSVPLIFVAVINLILFMVKLYIGIKTNSLCVYTDSINNLLDTVSSVISLISAMFITKEATKKHPFGFGRIEYILELVLSLIITLAGAYFAYTSLARLSMPTPVWFYFNFAIILGISCLVKLGIGIAFYRLYKKSNSVIFKTVMLDSFLDACITLVALISFSLSNSTGIVLDGFMGLAISIIIIASGIKLIISAVSRLIGNQNEEELEIINKAIKDIDSNIEIKNILINDYGVNNKYITICIKANTNDKMSIQSKLKAKLENGVYKKAYIEWEE